MGEHSNRITECTFQMRAPMTSTMNFIRRASTPSLTRMPRKGTSFSVFEGARPLRSMIVRPCSLSWSRETLMRAGGAQSSESWSSQGKS